MNNHHKKAIQYAQAQIEKLGAIKDESCNWLLHEGIVNKYHVETRHGKMSIHFDPDDHKRGCKEITAFCKFENPCHLGNPYSGKYNWHALDKERLDHFLNITLKGLLKS